MSVFSAKRKKRLGWNETFDNVKEAQGELNSKLEERYRNSLEQWTQITDGVLQQQLGHDWKTFHELDFSTEKYCLDNLDERERGGLLNPMLNQEALEVLKLSTNNLISLSCLNTRGRDGRLKFRKLRVLVASRNMLTEVRLELESLVVVNLSHNDLETLPSIKNLHLLERLLLSHNRIDGTLIDLASNRKLRQLDLSHNRFSWRPSLFKLQLDVLAQLHIEELRLGHNPFAECFSEYQFITLDRLDSITSLDGFVIDRDLMSDLRTKADELKIKNIDFSIFDVRVEDRRRNSARTEELGPVTGDGHVSTIYELVAALGKALDHPGEVVKHMDDFKQRVASVWTAFYRDRHKLMEMRDIKNEEEVEGAREQVVNEFADKMQQVLYRSDSVQKTCVTCLVQLLACDRLLGQRCARLLADWIDTSAGDLSSRVDDMSNALFKEIVDRVLPGTQSVRDSPAECYEATQGNAGNHDWGNADSVAESATILEALSQFGPSTFYWNFEASLSSRMLQPLLPALCRPPRSELGPEQPIDVWSEYKDFDAYPEDDIEPHEIQQVFLSKCRGKCQREGFGGFVTEENEDSPGWLYVHYKRKSPEALIGTRHRHEGRALHVRPIPLPRSRPPLEQQKYDVWAAWINGLAVLVTATADKYNAAHCVSRYSLHRVIIEHESNTRAGFTQAWLQVTPDAARAHTLFMQLARNLLSAAGEEVRYLVAHHFEEHGFHTRCWNRLRPHLIEAGAAIPVVRLNEKPVHVKETISSLVSVACAMNTGDENDPVSDRIMHSLHKDGLDVYSALLEISAYPEVPDPVLLAASLEAVYMFLSNDTIRPKILQHTLNRLHDGAIVLPYIRGPRYNDQDNPKYQELWRLCELDYGSKTTMTYSILKSGGPWKDHAPAFRDLQNPLMHRILLAIVKLIQLFSIKANSSELSGQLTIVTNVLDSAGREDFLIGPASGLVTCPNFDIKIECMKCISYILKASPQQFDMEEMGWVMRGLSPVGIGVGKQEDFLMEVLGLIMILIRTDHKTGVLFRQKFAKHAIRESFEMLRVNCRREVQGSQEEEESKNELSLKIVKLLQVCSGSASGGLRKFLRRVDLLQGLQDVIVYEDLYEDPASLASAASGGPQYGCGEALLRTWTGRDMRDVLWPLIVGNELKPRGRSRYHAIRRLADVLQGRPDFEPDSDKTERKSTDEALFWRGVTHMRRCLRQNDTEEDEDWKKQQESFAASDGISGLLGYAVRYLSFERYQAEFEESQKEVQKLVEKARNTVLMTWWLDASNARDDAGAGAAPDSGVLTATEQCCKLRLGAINERVMDLFGINLSVYDGKAGSTLDTLSVILAAYFDDNQERYKKMRDQDPKSCDSLEAEPSLYLCDGRLMPLHEIVESNQLFEKIKQAPVSDESAFEKDAEAAQLTLKRNVVLLNQHSNQVERWITSVTQAGGVSRLAEGLRPNLRNAQVLEVGRDIKELIRRLKRRKQYTEKDTQRRPQEGLAKMMNLASLTIEYPTAEDLLTSLNEMKATKRFNINILRIRNRFAKPTGLAERVVVVNVEILIKEHEKHIGELQLVVNEDLQNQEDGPVEHTERRRRAVLDKLEKVLADNCKGEKGAAEVAEVAEYLMYEMASRFLRHRDAVFITSKSQKKHLEVSKHDVFAKETTKLKTGQIFLLEREAGPGIIKSKDVVSLRARKANCYVDVSANGQCRARFTDATTQSQLKFVIEFNAYEQVKAGSGGKTSDQRPKMPKRVRDRLETSLQVGDQMKLRVKDTNTFLTVLPPTTSFALSSATSSFEKDASRKVKATDPGDLDLHQVFLVLQEGSMLDILSKETGTASEKTAGKSSDEHLEELLLRAHMCAKLPALDASLQEGGLFRRAPPSFKTIAERLTEADPELRERRADTGPGADAQVRADRQFSLIVSAMCRCAYVCCELPRSPASQNYVLDELLSDPGASVNCPITRLILVVMVAIRLQSKQGASNFAGVPAKFLRLVSVVLANAPALSMPATRRAAPTENSRAEEQGMETGFYDKRRLIFMVIIMSFVKKVLVESLHARLAVVAQRGLDEEELVLLREFAAMMDNMILLFFGNELRCKLETRGETDDMLEDQAGGRNNPSTQQALTDGTEAGAGTASEGGRRYGNGLMQSQRRTIFATLVSGETIKILVHAMLYAMHQEAMAYKDTTFRKADLAVRLVSSLVDRCISALCAAMHGCGDEESACAYDICEVISQTMTNGTQVVPRARIMQFMQERGTDALRGHIQTMLDNGDFDGSDATWAVERPKTVCTETAMVIAYARVGFVLPNQQVDDLPLCLVVVTSRLNMAVLDVPPGAGTLSMPVAHRPDDFSLRSFRDLKDNAEGQSQTPKLLWVVVNQRMRQFLGLWWGVGDGRNDSDQREVLIFDSSIRRRLFQKALRLVPKRRSERLGKSAGLTGSRLSKRQGIREVELNPKVLHGIRQASQKDAGQDTDIVNMTFIRREESLAASWGWGGHEEQVKLDMLVLTLDAILVVPLRSFLSEYAKEEEGSDPNSRDYYENCPLDGDLEETDSDGDELPKPKSQGQVPELVTQVPDVVPRLLSTLEGVWFLAEAEPKVKLTFPNKQSIELTFACETERQRWRRKLAYALEYQEKKARDTTHEDPKSAWQMVPTDKTDVSQVKNILIAERQEYMQRMAKNEARMGQGLKKKKQPSPALPQS